MRSIDSVADELYALPPAQFTAARDAAVATAREAGDRDAAKELSALKRPTQGAHLVNLLALHRRQVVDEIIGLGEQIRDAQGTVPAAQVRELSRQRRSALAAASRECRRLAAEAGSGDPTPAQLAEVEATLAAAMADDAAAQIVRSARVVKSLTYAGFGSGNGVAASQSAQAPPAGKARPAAHPAEEAERDERRRHARRRIERAEAELAAARAAEDAANAELDRIADELSRLRAALDNASRRASDARGAREAAQQELAKAHKDADPAH